MTVKVKVAVAAERFLIETEMILPATAGTGVMKGWEKAWSFLLSRARNCRNSSSTIPESPFKGSRSF